MRKQTSLFIVAGLSLSIGSFVVACRGNGKGSDAKANEIP
jgi:hypothetical protein